MEEQIYLYNSTICRLCATNSENGESLFTEDLEKPDISTMVNRYLPLKVYEHLYIYMCFHFLFLIKISDLYLTSYFQ